MRAHSEIQIIYILLGVLLTGLAVIPCSASILSVSTAVAKPGDKSVKVEINLANDSTYAGMEFCLSYNSAVLRIDSISPAARASDQSGSSHRPIGKGIAQFLVFDFAGISISADSGALFDVYFGVDSLAPDSQYILSVIDVAAVTPDLYYDSIEARSGVIEVIGTPILDNHHNDLPRTFSLRQNYPNPFNPSTVIEFQLPTRSHVTVIIYNSLGQLVKTIWDAETEAGVHRVLWDGKSSSSSSVSSGVYLYRIEAGDFRESKKMVLLK